VIIKYVQTVEVYLDGQLAGKIKKVSKDGTISGYGWQYFPKGQTKGGEIYPSLLACKKSLEDSDETN
jgi:hypothetical protein